ncbi:MAG: aldehyde dehydrogenase family protein [Acidimicrobiia bacterium]
MDDRLEHLTAGMPIVYGGNRVTTVPDALAAAFGAGDRLVVVQRTGDLLHVPAAEHRLVEQAVSAAAAAFTELGSCTDEQITRFFARFGELLADDAVFAAIAAANSSDVADARARGRSTTRLELTTKMRRDMIDGLSVWRDQPGGRDDLMRTIEHPGWRVEERRAPLGVVGFVFEGRPNVFADATGVLRTGNTVVFRIGSDALRTARSIMESTVAPALTASGLPAGAVSLLDTPSRAAGWALFSHPTLALAVARGSGQAVEQLGSVARQAGIPVSLHGTGGAWLVAGASADADRLERVVLHSLDRKVCNTLNVCCIPESRAAELVPRVLAALLAAAERRGVAAKLHVRRSSRGHVDPGSFTRTVTVRRAAGDVEEPFAELLDDADLGREWEWEESPEMTLAVVRDVGEAIELFNRYSPRLCASIVGEDAAERDAFWACVDAPFVGDGFTRWVDGQFALDAPELGLSNWEGGRLLARSAVLSGSSVHSVRLRAVQHDADLRR